MSNALPILKVFENISISYVKNYIINYTFRYYPEMPAVRRNLNYLIFNVMIGSWLLQMNRTVSLPSALYSCPQYRLSLPCLKGFHPQRI